MWMSICSNPPLPAFSPPPSFLLPSSCSSSSLLPLPLPSSSFLDEVSEAGEHAQEFLELLKRLTEDETSKWKSYLAIKGVLPKIGALIGKARNPFLSLSSLPSTFSYSPLPSISYIPPLSLPSSPFPSLPLPFPPSLHF